jgi:hypothetical protein
VRYRQGEHLSENRVRILQAGAITALAARLGYNDRSLVVIAASELCLPRALLPFVMMITMMITIPVRVSVMQFRT